MDYAVRLAFRDRTQATGQLEFCFRDVWHSACSGIMTQNDVNVICRELGFSDYEGTNVLHDYFGSTQLGPGLPPLSLDFLCSGSESSLSDCILEEETVGLNCIVTTVENLRCLGKILPT